MRKLVIVCLRCKCITGCVEDRMDAPRKKCIGCVSWNNCWVDNHDGELLETSTICPGCFKVIKNKAQKESIEH